jgi:hypothetical protein
MRKRVTRILRSEFRPVLQIPVNNFLLLITFFLSDSDADTAIWTQKYSKVSIIAAICIIEPVRKKKKGKNIFFLLKIMRLLNFKKGVQESWL